MTNGIVVVRDSTIIASEINSIKNQTKQIMLMNSIEIGRRLFEVKELIGHGNWGEWLETSVNYSQRTATNLMKIFTEYGANAVSELSDNSNWQSIANLSYTQAVSLLGLPSEDRIDFVEKYDVENISVKEMNELIKEKKDIEQKLKLAEAETTKLTNENKDLIKDQKKTEKILTKTETTITGLETKVTSLETDIKDSKEKLEEYSNTDFEKSNKELADSIEKANKKIKTLEKKLKEKPAEVEVEKTIEVIPDETITELNNLRLQVKRNEFEVEYRMSFSTLVNGFKNLLGTLEKAESVEDKVKYSEAVKGLITKMGENL